MSKDEDVVARQLREAIEYGVNGFITAGDADKDGVYPELIESGEDIRDMKDHLIKNVLEINRASLASEREKIRKWAEKEDSDRLLIHRSSLIFYLSSLDKGE